MCDVVVKVERSRVLFAKNSNREPNEAQRLEWHPARRHPSGATVRCTWMTIPQARETLAVLISRPFWMWGAEMGANEAGVTIGNVAVFTDEPYASRGLTGMDLLRLALERADSAEGAVSVLVDLLERYGQGGGCGYQHAGFTYHNGFLVADERGAFVVETAGRDVAIEAVTGTHAMSNALTLPDFRRRHPEHLKTAVSRADSRRELVGAAARRAGGPRDLMAALRSHGPDRESPPYALLNGAMGCPCNHAGGVVANAQTTGSWVSELGPDGVRHWATGTAAPCLSLFKPVSVEHPVDVGWPTARADNRSLWWRHERFHRQAVRDYGPAGAAFFEERDRLEAGWCEHPPASAEAFAVHRSRLHAWVAAVRGSADRRPVWTRLAWRHWNRRAGL
jgi:dipeptidase